MGISLGRSASAKACAAVLVLSLPVAGGVAWADGVDGVDGVAASGKAAAFAEQSGVLSDAELNEFGIASTDTTPIVDWTACGTCEWMIDGAGCLTIRPANGADSGELDATIPWREYREEVRAVEVEGKVKAQTLKSAFYRMSNLVRADLSNLDTSNVSSMQSAFESCESLVSLDLSNWDTSNVTDKYGMAHMFLDCFSLKSLDASNWDTSSVTDMGYMFYHCKALTSLDLSGWDTSSVTNMELMFAKCSSLVSIEGLSGWDTSSVTDMGAMFSGCSSLASLDLSGWDTSKVRLMYCMFLGCSSLASVGDLSGWAVDNVYYMPALFSGCSSLESLNLSSWDVSDAYAGSNVFVANMFNGCSSLQTISLSDSFSFAKGSYNSEAILLPTLVGCELTGKWVSSVDGGAYAPEDVPSNVAATYTAEPVVFPNPARTFPDVDYAQWYADGVTFCARKGLITGYASGEFGVGNSLTRAELAAILWRHAEPEVAEAYDGNAANTTGMGDVADNEWYTGAANWAVANEVINGVDKGDHRDFCPNDPVTAEQLATILANYAAENSGNTHYHYCGVCNDCGFTWDVDDEWAMVEHVGDTGHGGYVNRFKECSRTDCAGTKRAYVNGKLEVVTGEVPVDLGVLDSFADAGAISDWARESVAWAKSKGIVNGYEEGGFRLLKPYEEIARERVATILMNSFESGVLK